MRYVKSYRIVVRTKKSLVRMDSDIMGYLIIQLVKMRLKYCLDCQFILALQLAEMD